MTFITSLLHVKANIITPDRSLQLIVDGILRICVAHGRRRCGPGEK
jgi:hypothetical protein